MNHATTGTPATRLTIADLQARIRDIPNFPQPGIIFRDITPLLADADSFQAVVDTMAAPFRGKVDTVVAIESRGFILGAPIAYALGAGLVLVRKPGKLPSDVETEAYTLEYGQNTLEIHRDALARGQRALIVDDLLATGGTVRAAANLVNRLGGHIAGVCVLAELSALNGRAHLTDLPLTSFIVY
jgi:adenine phosphoribosyltransferase